MRTILHAGYIEQACIDQNLGVGMATRDCACMQELRADVLICSFSVK